MAGRSTIPEVLWPDVLEQNANGWSTRKIADWLGHAHGVKVSHHSVAELLKNQRQQREEITKALVRERLGRRLTLDLDALEAEGKRVRKVSKLLFAAVDDGNLDQAPAYLKAAEQHRKLIETKLKFAGADTPDDSLSALADAERRFLDKLARAAGQAERGAEGEAGAEPGGDPTGEGGG